MSSSHLSVTYSWTKFWAKFGRKFHFLTGPIELIYCSKDCKVLPNNIKCRFRDAKFQNLQRDHAASPESSQLKIRARKHFTYYHVETHLGR